MSGWTYNSGDPGLALYTAALKGGAPMPVKAGDHLLDVGCNEANWMTLAHAAWPDIHLTGIDWCARSRIEEPLCWVRANGLERGLFAPETFDGIVSLSAVEHFGLGHYHHDPIDTDGDIRIVANMLHWLKPGGWLYFDVPYDPRGYRISGTEYRAYDHSTLRDRLWVEAVKQAQACCQWQWTGYVQAWHCYQLMEQPTTQADDRLAYYVACVFQKQPPQIAIVGGTSKDESGL